MMAQLGQQQAGTVAEGLERFAGVGDRHGAVADALQGVAGEVPERAAGVDRPFLEPIGGVGNGPDFPEVEAGAFEQNGRREIHRTQRADGAAVASRLSPDAMKLKAIRANLAALQSSDWTVVHDDEGCLVIEANGPMSEQHFRLCTFDHAAGNDAVALISSAPETIGFLLSLIDRATRALRPAPPARDGWAGLHGRAAPRGEAKNLAAEAGMLCGERAFMVFLEERHGLDRPLTADKAAQKVRSLCGVTSRKDFNNDERAAAAWQQLGRDYRAWKRAGR